MPVNHPILHVDEDLRTSDALAELMMPHGYRLQAVDDPRKAFESIVDGGYWVVVLNVELTSIDAFELLKEIKAYNAGVQVIVISEMLSVEQLVQARTSGAEAVVLRPLQNHGLLLELLDETFRRLNRWRDMLDDVSHAQLPNGSAHRPTAPRSATTGRPHVSVSRVNEGVA